MSQDGSAYRDELGRVLRGRDPAALRTFLMRSAAQFGDQQQVDEVSGLSHDALAERMHRMIVARPDLADLHRASREWLFKRGVDSFGAGGTRRN